MNDEMMAKIRAFQQEQAAIRAARRAQLEGMNYVVPRDLFTEEDSLPQYPWVWFRGQLVVLKPSGQQEQPNVFGGVANTAWRGLAKGCRPYRVLDLDPQSLPLQLPNSGTFSRRLPLFHPLKCSNGPEMLYRIENDGSMTATQSPAATRGDRDWPYPDYPESLPAQGLEVDGPYPIPILLLLEGDSGNSFCPQPLPEDADQFLVVVVPACNETFGMSLLGEDAEGAQIVFLVHPETGAVWTYNHCG